MKLINESIEKRNPTVGPDRPKHIESESLVIDAIKKSRAKLHTARTLQSLIFVNCSDFGKICISQSAEKYWLWRVENEIPMKG
jgi:hypothetical protein